MKMSDSIGSNGSLNVIDLKLLISEEVSDVDETVRNKEEVLLAQQINDSFESIGFLILKNHGVPVQTIESVRIAAKTFFIHTSDEIKRQCSYRAPVPRGYSGNCKENFAILAGEKKPNDLVEKFRMGPCNFDSNNPYFSGTKDAEMMYYPNKWPEHDTSLKMAMEEYYKSMEILAKVLFRLFERCLSLPRGFFDNKIDRHTSILSANHYPPIHKQEQKEQLRLAEHTDVDLFTILCPDWNDKFGCLQVKKNDVWEPVPIHDDTFIVNIGDCFSYWTNGRWVSTCHRVIVPSEKEGRLTSRIALGYFVGANYDAEIHQLPSDTSEWKNEDTTYVGWRKVRIYQALAKLRSRK
jgi:isopenicillin N synthase-like dioxygenase